MPPEQSMQSSWPLPPQALQIPESPQSPHGGTPPHVWQVPVPMQIVQSTVPMPKQVWQSPEPPHNPHISMPLPLQVGHMVVSSPQSS
jgi:hypothetical protein